MARAFPGGASTDRITVTRYAEVDNLATLSVGAWVYKAGAGGSGAGMVLSKGAPGGPTLHEGNPRLAFYQANRWSGNPGVWWGDATPLDLNVWYHVLWTYSYTSTSTVPICYINGSPKSVTPTSAPTGTATRDDSAIDVTIGNRANAYCWNGRLAHVAIWNRILTGDEARYLCSVPPDTPQSGGALTSGLVLCLPLTGTSSPEPNTAKPANPGVVTGTSNAAGPALFVPGGPMPLTSFASGTQTLTVGTEHTVAAINQAGVYVVVVDTVTLAAGDTVDLRIKKIVLAGGTKRTVSVTTWSGAQSADDLIKQSLPIPNDLTDTSSVEFTLKQTAGTSRAVPWNVLKIG